MESHSSMPAHMTLSASSEEFEKPATNARLNSNKTWCSLSTRNEEYLSVNLGKLATVTGIAIQGDPTASNWVKNFTVKHGSSITTLETYQQDGKDKVCSFIS